MVSGDLPMNFCSVLHVQHSWQSHHCLSLYRDLTQLWYWVTLVWNLNNELIFFWFAGGVSGNILFLDLEGFTPGFCCIDGGFNTNVFDVVFRNMLSSFLGITGFGVTGGSLLACGGRGRNRTHPEGPPFLP